MNLKRTATIAVVGGALAAWLAGAATSNRSIAAPIAPVAPKPALTDTLPAFTPAQPSLKLAGIGEDAGPDGPLRIAFITGEGQLFMVKEGENVTPRYRVTQISGDVVELLDLAT